MGVQKDLVNGRILRELLFLNYFDSVSVSSTDQPPNLLWIFKLLVVRWGSVSSTMSQAKG